MSSVPDAPDQQAPPRWLIALAAGIFGVLLLGAGLLWFTRGTAIILDIAAVFCL